MDVRNQVGDFAERISPDEVQAGNRGDHIARYLFAAQFVAGRSVADLCCGVGYGANLLLAAGAQTVTGFDRDHAVIGVARRHYSKPAFEVAEVDQPLDLKDVDVAVCFEGIEHVADPDRLLSNMLEARLTLISSPNAAQYEHGFSGNPHHVREWTRQEFEEVLARHFSRVQMYFQWSYPDPLDQRWTVATALKALVPIALKSRMRAAPDLVGPTDMTTTSTEPIGRVEHAVLPASYLSTLPPGLRYGTPHTWLAVCKPS